MSPVGAAPATPQSPDPGASPTLSLRGKLALVAALYFAEGLPYGVFNELIPTYFAFQGVSVTEIGLAMGLGSLPWTFKFIWAPLVDQTATRRRWIAGTQLALAIAIAALALTDVTRVTPAVWVMLGALTLCSATQDIAVDAYSIELLEEREYGAANGVRVTFYRIALIGTGGLLVALAGTLGWSPVFLVAAAVMLGLSALSTRIPSRRIERPRGQTVAQVMESAVWHPLRGLLRLPAMWATLVFVLTFKLGDFALLPMIRPFWVQAGYSPEEIGLVIGTIGMMATIGGALLGGWLTTRWGIFTALWSLGLVQALSNLGYYVAAAYGATQPVIYSAAVVEQFTGGLGTAAFLAFLMALCDRRFAATQYALLSALFGLCRSLAGTVSGFATQELGFASYFLLTFALAFPAFALLPAVRKTLRGRAAARAA